MCSEWGIFVTLLGLSHIDSIISEIFSAIVVLSQMGLIFKDASFCLCVCIRRSTIPDARWSRVGRKKV